MATTPVSLAQFGQNIKAKHPEYGDMADEDVASRVLKKYPQYQDMVLPAGATGPLPGVPQPPNPMQPPTMLDRAATGLTNAGDALVGAGKGALHTISSTDQFARDHLPAVLTNSNLGFGKPADLQNVQRMATPNNTAQKVGYGAEQVGEFLAPGGAEEKAAAKLASALPKFGKFAAPLSRVATAALSSGVVNKAQGGDFTTGAAMGGAGGAVGEGLRAAAPIIAESALGVRAADRRAPISPGRAILNETTGINPRNIADQATQKQSLYTADRNGLLASAPPVDLTPARQVAKNAQGVAARQNNPETIKRTSDLSNLLTYEGGKVPPSTPAPPKVIPGFSGAASAPPAAPTNLIPPQVTAMRANDIKTGLGDLKNSWNPATPNTFADAAVGRAYGTLDKGIDAAAPGTSALNDKISALFPVASRATATDLNASALQRILGRFTRPTGALVGGAAGAGYGYKEDGVRGALAGAALGVAAPEVVGSPTAQMLIARGAGSYIMPPTVRALTGTGLQATRKPSLYDANK